MTHVKRHHSLRLPLWTSLCMSFWISTACLSQHAWMASRNSQSSWIGLRWRLHCLFCSEANLFYRGFCHNLYNWLFLLVFHNRGLKRLKLTWNQAGSWSFQCTTNMHSGMENQECKKLWSCSQGSFYVPLFYEVLGGQVVSPGQRPV